MESSRLMVNFIAIKVRLMEFWDAGQRGDKGGKAVGVGLAFANGYRCLLTKVGRRFVSVYMSLSEDRSTENQSITNIYLMAGIGEVRIYTSYMPF